MENKRIEKKLILIFLFALLLRIGFIMMLDNTVDVWGDWWDELGLKIAGGQGFWVNNPYFKGGTPFYSWRPPGFPFFLAGIYSVFGHSYLAAKIGLALLSALSCILLFFIASDVFDSDKAGTWCAVIYAVYPPSIFWTGYLSPVTNEIFLMLLIVLLILKWGKNKRSICLIAAGFFTGAAVLTRSNFLVLIPAAALFLLVKYRKFLWKGLALYLLAGLITLAPWIIRNYRIHKTFVLTSTEGGVVCYIANNKVALSLPTGYLDPVDIEGTYVMDDISGLSEVRIDRYFYREALVFIRNNPAAYLRLVKDRFFRFWKLSPHTFSGPGESYKSYHVKIAFLTNLPVFILAMAGFLFSLKRWRDFSFFYLLVIFWSVPIILLFKTIIRYREPLMPFIIIFAYLTIHSVLNRFRRKNAA
ncbi:MAG: glycosyltransferase family 39 protein [Candidatus Omnitrophica bacterium]|nr:glycosyltransferase family 39 protein [Candidatus Omnitrophota bacterium]